jgi:hypothetical protein
MNVEKNHAITLGQGAPIDASKRTPDGIERPRRNMPGNDRVRNAGETAVTQVHVRATDFRALGAQQRASRWKVGAAEFSDFNGLEGRGHHRGQDAGIHAGTLLWDVGPRTCFLALAMLIIASSASAQTYVIKKPRRHFITISSDWLYTQPLHFAEHPLADLTGRDVISVQFEAYEYRTRDDATLIDVIEFGRRQRGLGIAVYPFGVSSGPTLVLRGSFEQLPRIQIALTGPSPVARYQLTDGRAFDAALGVTVADRSGGWGLGSHAFVVGGLGRVTSGLGDGRRLFAEGGGGLDVGPFGIELGVKFAWNKLSDPVQHQFLTVPITLRGTLTF